jgi:uncharacterized protein (TIGR02466 family)
MADVKKINLFPTTIYSYKSEITDAENKLMLDYIYGKFDNKYKDVRTGEGLPFGLEQGEDNLHFVDAFQPLVKFAEALSYNIFKEEGYLHQDVEITQMWANKQEDGSIHPPHTHANSLHSGIYYIRASENTAGTQFFEPRAQVKCLVPRREKYIIQNSHMYQVHSVAGEGVVFPSWLQHWVPPNKDERITISWNIIVRGEYGEANTLQNARF